MSAPTYNAITTAPQTLQLETFGTFTVGETRDDSCRCGLIGSSRTLGYRVVIESAPEWLNDKGFIYDWQALDSYFKDTFRTLDVFPSCERIACRACEDIVSLLGGRCHALDVFIGGEARPAGMKASWRRPASEYDDAERSTQVY